MVSPMYLTLLAGPVEPVPAPKVLVDALVSVQVQESATGRSGFQLTFTLSDRGILETFFLLAGSSPIAQLRVVLLITFAGLPQVLIDGIVLHTEVQPDAMSGSSMLVVSGEDLCALMDLVDFSGLPYPATSPDARVRLVLAKYVAFGILPEVVSVPTPDIPYPSLQIPAQKRTDLRYVQALAAQVGYVFYMVPGPLPGQSVAYWGPQQRVGMPQNALNVNLDTWTNVESLSFRYEPQASVLPIVRIKDFYSGQTIRIPIPPITPFNPPLGLVVPPPQKTEQITGTSKLTLAQATMRGYARSVETADVVTGDGALDVMRYGQPLRARSLVGVRGAGLPWDGMHFVESATHSIKLGEYKQTFVLKRNALIADTSSVPSLPF
jgi:hypothetical protein